MPFNTPQEVEAQVQELVSNSKLSKAITLLIGYFKEVGDEPRHQATLKLSAQAKSIEKKLMMTEITEEAANVGFSKITDAILNIFEAIPLIADDASPSSETDKFGERIIQISALIIIVCLIVGIILAVVTQGVDPIIKALQASLFVVGASMVAFGLLFLVKKYIIV